MSPRRVGALLLVLAATLVAGCDVLPGRDSESGFVPQAGACHRAAGDNASGEAYQAVGVDVLHLPPTEDEAAAGATYVLCLLHTDGRPLTRSLPGVGVRGLPAPR